MRRWKTTARAGRKQARSMGSSLRSTMTKDKRFFSAWLRSVRSRALCRARDGARNPLPSTCVHGRPHRCDCLAGARGGKGCLTQGCARNRACDMTQVCSITGAFFCRGRCTHIEGFGGDFVSLLRVYSTMQPATRGAKSRRRTARGGGVLCARCSSEPRLAAQHTRVAQRGEWS